MRIECIAVGQPEDHVWNGKTFRTAIYKKPIPGPVMIREHNVDGDRQASTDIHGGKYKAVYVYSADHYPWWRAELGRDLPFAMFGENLTVSGWDDSKVCIGDVYRFGEAELEAVGPRLPCSKLAMKFGDPHMIKRFSDASRWGLYHAVRKPGLVKIGDSVEKVSEHPARVQAFELGRVYVHDMDDVEGLARLIEIEGLDPDWEAALLERLHKRLQR
jgi:MOSC domain-containing protein YiiM